MNAAQGADSGVSTGELGLADRLITGSLADLDLLRATEGTPNTRLLPFASVLKIGGQSLIDRGRRAVFPLLEEIHAALDHHHLIIGTGAGTRARHAYSVGVDLGLPTGVLVTLGTGVALQNAKILAFLLAKKGVPIVLPNDFGKLPHFLLERRAVIFPGMPPYTFWEHNPSTGLIPPHRTDTGVYLVAEVFGAQSLIYVKDEDGLFTDDPKKSPKAEFIPRIGAGELLERGIPDLVIERPVLEMLQTAQRVRSVQIINGLVPGNLTRALAGEHVGTVIEADG